MNNDKQFSKFQEMSISYSLPKILTLFSVCHSSSLGETERFVLLEFGNIKVFIYENAFQFDIANRKIREEDFEGTAELYRKFCSAIDDLENIV